MTEFFHAPSRDASDQRFRKSLNRFFASTLLYDLTRQWILEDGPFRYDFHWLTGRHDNAELITWAKTMFDAHFGVHPDEFNE